VTGKDRYRLGRYSFIHDPGGQQRQRAAAQQAYSTYVLSQERWDNYRREADHLVVPIREMALAADKAAVDLAQSALKTSVLINVGGFIAIQAAVPLSPSAIAFSVWQRSRTRPRLRAAAALGLVRREPAGAVRTSRIRARRAD
jgi:hypothetical protein